MNLQDAINVFRDKAFDFNLSAEKVETAHDLIAKGTRWGWTWKQERFLISLARQATGEAVRPFSIGTALIEFMDAAVNDKNKWPKLHFTIGGGRVVIGRTGEKAKCGPGCLNLTDGGPFGNNTWFGRVDREGNFSPSASCTKAVAQLLTDLGDDPEGFLAEFGKLTGNCCFCNRELTDDRSKDAGWGPVCAKKFGLPWGEKLAA